MPYRVRGLAVAMFVAVICWCGADLLSGSVGSARYQAIHAITADQPVPSSSYFAVSPRGMSEKGNGPEGAGMSFHLGMPHPGRSFVGSLAAASGMGLVFFLLPPWRRTVPWQRKIGTAGNGLMGHGFNRRMSRRIMVDPPACVSLSVGGAPAGNAWLDNMSLSGVALAWNGLASIGQKAVLNIQGAQPIAATVVAQDSRALRLRFDDMSPVQMTEIVSIRANGTGTFQLGTARLRPASWCSAPGGYGRAIG